MHSDPVLFSVCFCNLLVTITTQLQLHITCNGLMTVYHGKLQPEQLITANISANYTIIPGTEILAVRCKNFESKPLILASLSNGMITDSRWKCFSFPNNEYFTGVPWTRTEFNDSHWARPSQSSQTEGKVQREKSRASKMKLFGYQPLKITQSCSAGEICLMMTLICLYNLGTIGQGSVWQWQFYY